MIQGVSAIKGISAILLDLDGTLVDSAPELAAAVNGALGPLGRRALDVAEVRTMIGNGIPVLTQRALAATGGEPPGDKTGREETEAIIEEVRRLYDCQPLPAVYDGVTETLTRLHQAGHKLIICTNKPEGSARQLLAGLGLDHLLADVVGGDRLKNRKPHPDHLLKPLKALGIAPGAAVMVGDSDIDARAAKAAGIAFIAVSYGYAKLPAAELGAAAVVDHFADILDVITG
jgi:phosphoglycolate phosphatase